MIPIVDIPETIAQGMKGYRQVFRRQAGFEHVSRYISGLLLSENKTLQGIAAQQVYPEGAGASRRAMHAAVFEAGWESEKLMRQHRVQVGKQHQGRGREVISLDWTQSHHEEGFHIYGGETLLRLCQPLHESVSDRGDSGNCQSDSDRRDCSRGAGAGL